MKTTAIILMFILSDWYINYQEQQQDKNIIKISQRDYEKQIEKQKQNDLQNEFYLNKLKHYEK